MMEAAPLIEDGLALIARERRLLLRGEYADVDALADEKAAFIERFVGLDRDAPALAAVRERIAELVAQARINERLLAAAREGIASARRRIDALAATRAGAVAYRSTGARIHSRADSDGKSKRA